MGERSASSSFDIAQGTYTYYSQIKTPTKEEGETCDMRSYSTDILKVVRKIGSIAIRAAAFYMLYWLTVIFSFGSAEVLTGYAYPDNPVESDYPVPALYNLVVVCVPYVFWFLVIAAYDLVKNVRKNA